NFKYFFFKLVVAIKSPKSHIRKSKIRQRNNHIGKIGEGGHAVNFRREGRVDQMGVVNPGEFKIFGFRESLSYQKLPAIDRISNLPAVSGDISYRHDPTYLGGVFLYSPE